MTMGPFRDLLPLLRPEAVAVVGASERHGSAGRLVLENLRNLEYQGAVYTVHPKYKEVLGFPCYNAHLDFKWIDVDPDLRRFAKSHVTNCDRSIKVINAEWTWPCIVSLVPGGS